MPPSWLNKEKPTRDKSSKQEKKLAKEIGGRTFANSGATYSQNDVRNKELEIEAKATDAKQFTLKAADIKKMNEKCSIDRTAIFLVEFLQDGEEVVILRKRDFYALIGLDPFK